MGDFSVLCSEHISAPLYPEKQRSDTMAGVCCLTPPSKCSLLFEYLKTQFISYYFNSQKKTHVPMHALQGAHNTSQHIWVSAICRSYTAQYNIVSHLSTFNYIFKYSKHVTTHECLLLGFLSVKQS